MRCDAHAFAQMYETVYIDLYRFALCLVKNKQEADLPPLRGGIAAGGIDHPDRHELR